MTNKELVEIEKKFDEILIEYAKDGMVLSAGKDWFQRSIGWVAEFLDAMKEAREENTRLRDALEWYRSMTEKLAGPTKESTNQFSIVMASLAKEDLVMDAGQRAQAVLKGGGDDGNRLA